jgi:hypothetical protein
MQDKLKQNIERDKHPKAVQTMTNLSFAQSSTPNVSGTATILGIGIALPEI